MYKSISIAFSLSILLIMIGCDSVQAPTEDVNKTLQLSQTESSTVVPGHQDRYDEDNNGYPDEGVVVNGKYKSLYAYDANNDFYWDLGDGRVQGTVGSVSELDQSTLTTCDYKVIYRGSFENDPFMDSGWIRNNINCTGEDKFNQNFLIVHKTDRRYTGNKTPAFGGDWEYHVDARLGEGNIIRPENHAGE